MTLEPPKTIAELLPDFADELVRLIHASKHPELAAQVAELPVVERCSCGQSNCAHFYTAPRPKGRYPSPHFNVMLAPRKGLLVLDVVADRIVAVEILNRPDVKGILDRHLPPTVRE